MADISLLFDVAGGGNINGESGREIFKQLESIVNTINKNPFKIKFEADETSLNAFKEKIDNLKKEIGQDLKISTGNISGRLGKSGGKTKRKAESPEVRMQKEIDAAWSKQKAEHDAQNAIQRDIHRAYEERNKRIKEEEDAVKKASRSEIDWYDKINSALGEDSKSLNDVFVRTNRLEKRLKTVLGFTSAKFGKSQKSYEAVEGLTEKVQDLKNNLSTVTKEEALKKLKEFEKILSDAEVAFEKNNEKSKTFADRIKTIAKRFSEWFSVTHLITQAYQLLRRMVTAVVDIDSAMTELKKVTNETAARYDSFLRNASVRSKNLGASLSDTVRATADFARLGYSIDEAEKMADAAIIYKNVGDGIQDINTASESIIATMQAFGVKANEVMTIVDKFNEVGNNFAVSSSGIGDALLRSAAAMHSAGSTIDETIALVAAANTIVQNPETVGTTLKTVSMYLRAAKTEAEEAGESTEGMASSVSELRKEILELTGQKVDIMIDEDTFKNPFKIMKELSDVWSTLTDTTRANILEMVGGKRNANIVAALLENFTVAEEALEKSLNSAGSAAKENEKHLESIEGRISLLKAAFESLSSTIVDDDAIKIIVSGLTGIISGVDELIQLLGGLKVLLPTITGILISKNLPAIMSFFGSLKAPAMINSIGKYIGSFRALFTLITHGAPAASGALSALGGSAAVLGNVFTALVPIIGLAIAAISNHNRKIEEARQKQIESSKSASVYSNELSELYEKYISLSAAVSDGEAVSEEYISVQNDIIDKLGLHGKKVDELIEKYGDYQTAITEATKAELENQRLIMLGATSAYEDAIIASGNDSKVKKFNLDSDRYYENMLAHSYIYNSDKYARILSSFSILNDGSGTGVLDISGLGFDLDTYEGVIDAHETILELLKELKYNGAETSDVFSALSQVYTYLEGSINDYENHLEKLKKNIIQSEYLTVTSILGTPSDQESFDQFRNTFISFVSMTDDLKSSYEDASHAVDEFLSKQGAFAEFFKEINNDTSNTSLAILNKFQEKIVILKSALNEYNQTGEVTSDTYNKVIALSKDCEDSTKDCAEMFDFSSGKIKLVKDNLDSYVDSLVGETGKTLAANEATANQIALMAALADSVKSNEKAAEQAADDMKSLMTVLDGVKDKSRYGTAELYDLIRQYPELESAIIETADGYTFEESAIVSLIEQKAKMVKVNNILLTQQAKEARNALILASNNVATAENIDAIISKYNVDSFDTGKNSYINAWKEHFNQKETPVFIKGVKEYVEAVLAEKEYVKTVEGLLKDVMSGEYYAGDKDSGGNRKTAFEKEYERHQHLLAMNKEDVSSYLSWLRNAYKNALNAGELTTEDAYRYEEEIYEKTRSLFDAEYRYHQHLLAMGKETESSYLSWLSKAYKSAYKERKIDLDSYYQYEEEVHEKLKKLRTDTFNKKIESKEFDIEVLEHDNADDKTILASWESILSDINNEIDYYQKLGYKKTDETLSSLLKRAIDVEKEIQEKTKDIFNDSINDVDAAIERKLRKGDTDSVVKLYQTQIKRIQSEIEKYRKLGLDNHSDYIQELESMLWGYQDKLLEALQIPADGMEKSVETASNGLNTILELTKELIAWENEQAIEALENEKDAYSDIIDKKKEALSLSREQQKHDRSSADKLAEIAELQSKIDQLALDDSREAAAKKAQLEKELSEKQKTFAEDQADYAYDKQIDALDREYEAFEDSKDKEIDALRDTLNSEEKLYRAAIDRINNNWDSLYEDLLLWNFNYGSSLQSDLVSAWNAASDAAKRYGSFVGALDGVNSDFSSDTKSDGYAASIVGAMKQNSAMWTWASASERKNLEERNVTLAAILGDYLGKTITRDEHGVWSVDGENLYDKYISGSSVSHTESSDYASTVVGMMKKNSSMWASATDKSILEEKNVALAEMLASFLGKKITRGADGVWMIDGKRLYDIYHSGGIVGGNGTLSQHETMALLENGEMVLDDKKQKFLLSAVDFLADLSKRIGSTIDVSKLSAISVLPSKKSNFSTMLDKLENAGNREFDFHPEVNVYISHNGNMSDADAKRYGEAAAESVLDKLNSAFSRRGIIHAGNNIIKT